MSGGLRLIPRGPIMVAALTAALAAALPAPAAHAQKTPEPPPGVSSAPADPAFSQALGVIGRCVTRVRVNGEPVRLRIALRFQIGLDRHPVPGTFRLEESSSDDAEANEAALRMMERAVMRCGQEGFDLPPAFFETRSGPAARAVSLVFDLR